MIKKPNFKLNLTKRLKTIIAAALALVLLVSAVLVLEFWPSDSGNETSSAGSSSIQSGDKDSLGYINVFSYKASEVRDVVVKNEFDGFTIKYVDKDTRQVKGAEKFAVNKTAIDSLIESCQELPATKLIAENPKDLSIYEISDKGTVAEVAYSTGEKLTLMIGTENAAGSSYVYLKQNDKVYLVESGWADPFKNRYSAYLDLSISDGFEKDEEGYEIDPHVTRLSYTGRGLKNPIVIEENPEYVAEQEKIEEGVDLSTTVTQMQYIFTSPMRVDISNDAYSGLQNQYFGLTALDIYSLNPTAADKAKCGLTNPYVTIEVTATKRNLKIILGDTIDIDGTEYYYAMSNERTPIFIVEAADFSFFKEDLVGYMSSILINVMIDEIHTMTVETNGEKYVFEESGEGDGLVVRWNGKKLSTQEYRDLFTLIMLAHNEESVEPGKYKDAPYLKITLNYREREKVDVVEFVKAETRKYLIRLNGSDLALVRSKYVDTLVYGVEAFTQGKDVPSDY